MFSVDLFTVVSPLFQVTELQEFCSRTFILKHSFAHKCHLENARLAQVEIKGASLQTAVLNACPKEQRGAGAAVAAAVVEITLEGGKQNYF